MNIFDKIKKAPKQPGCYLFKNDLDRVIYVGKAKDLKNRIGWYYRKENQVGKTASLVQRIVDVEFIVTDTEVEALLLEAELIKKYQPKYNIQLKDSVRYAYIRITKDKFPKLETARTIKKTDQVFGPYVSGQSRQQAIRLANSLFKLRVCRKLPKRACLLYHIKQCSAPCINNISEKEYNENIEKAAWLLKGKTQELVEKLNYEMKDYSAQQKYELAKIRRDQILALKNIAERQKVSLKRRYNQDVINYFSAPNKFVVQIFNIDKGIISGRQEFSFAVSLLGDARQSLSDFIRQYYYSQEIPQEVIVPIKLPEQKLLEKYLEKIAGHRVKIFVPQKGDKLKLLAMLKKNIEIGLKAGESSLVDLQNVLSLSVLPRIIECFDISNLGASDVVGSMVCFKDGLPDKNNYRRFKIKTVVGQSDYDCMKEVVYRRYYGLIKEKGRFPDLIMVDGGKPQLSAAQSALRELGLTLPLIALAKRDEEIFTLFKQYPIILSKKSSALKMIQKIRDEAHRFAIKYHRLLRSKKDFKI
ncbi:MAG: excinuclease ABC subunit UvrC [Candidatus Buchananbacteria bacterium]